MNEMPWSKTFVFHKSKPVMLWNNKLVAEISAKFPLYNKHFKIFHQKKYTLKRSNQVVLIPFVEVRRQQSAIKSLILNTSIEV